MSPLFIASMFFPLLLHIVHVRAEVVAPNSHALGAVAVALMSIVVGAARWRARKTNMFREGTQKMGMRGI